MTAGGLAMTVAGPVSAAGLGRASMHEHLWMYSSPLLAVHGYVAAAAEGWDAGIAAEARCR